MKGRLGSDDKDRTNQTVRKKKKPATSLFLARLSVVVDDHSKIDQVKVKYNC